MSDFFPLPRVDLLVYSPSPAAFVPVLSELLEPSPRLTNLLIPQLHATLQALIRTPSQLPKTYASLIALCAATVNAWDVDDKAAFLACHPRIGETKGLSAASSAEQGQTPVGAAQGTPGEVLKRLGILNSLYEESFPGLRFVTFVNGRTRAAIVPELEGILGLSLPPPSASTPEPTLSSLRTRASVRITGSKAWRDELQRGLNAVFNIALARLAARGSK